MRSYLSLYGKAPLAAASTRSGRAISASDPSLRQTYEEKMTRSNPIASVMPFGTTTQKATASFRRNRKAAMLTRPRGWS